MKKSRIFDPKHVAVLETEDRRLWQNPKEILGAVRIKRNFVAADLGCGSGFFTVPLAEKAKKVYGIDVQKEMLEFLERKIQRLKINNITLLLSEENEIPLGHESVDLLVSVNTLHEFNYKERIIEEIYRVLKKGGRALIADFKKENTDFGPPIAVRVAERQAVSLFRRKGFIVLKTQDLQYHYLLVFSK
jgi:ubiquinone/menaquinone biosynthesis C-methylase UbiE